MRKQLVALTLSAAMAAGMLSGCGGYGSGSGGQKDAAEAAGTAAGAAATTAAAGSDGTAEPAKASTADGEPILIGALYPMTGALADSGQNMEDGIDLAVEEINAAGGISGRPIQIVYGDTQGANATGMTEMERLITQDKVMAVMGAYQSGVTEVVSQVAENYQVPMITANATSDSLTSHGYEYFFRLAPTNMMFIRDMEQYLLDLSAKDPADDIDVKSVAVCADNTELGQQTATWAKYFAEENGLEFKGEVLYSQGAADLTSEVLQLKSLNPDALIVDNYVSDAILLTKTMNEQGYKPNIMIAKANGYTESSYLPSVGGLANGILTATEFLPGDKGTKVSDAFKAKYGVDMNGHSAEAYTVVWIFRTALQNLADAGKEITSEALKDELSTLEIKDAFPGGEEIILPYDTIKFSESEFNGIPYKNTNMDGKLTIAQFQDGSLVTVWPFDIAKHDTIYPAPFN